MTLREQALSALLTLFVIPTLLKIFDALMAAVRRRFGTTRRKTYGELEQENWRLRDTLRRVFENVEDLAQWQELGKYAEVTAGIANLQNEIDPKLLEPLIPKVN